MFHEYIPLFSEDQKKYLQCKISSYITCKLNDMKDNKMFQKVWDTKKKHICRRNMVAIKHKTTTEWFRQIQLTKRNSLTFRTEHIKNHNCSRNMEIWKQLKINKLGTYFNNYIEFTHFLYFSTNISTAVCGATVAFLLLSSDTLEVIVEGNLATSGYVTQRKQPHPRLCTNLPLLSLTVWFTRVVHKSEIGINTKYWKFREKILT